MMCKKRVLHIFTIMVASMFYCTTMPLTDKEKKRYAALGRRESGGKAQEAQIQMAQPWEQIKEKFLTPIGATYLYESVAGLIDDVRNIFKGYSAQLNNIASTLETIGQLVEPKLVPIRAAPEKLRLAAQDIETKFIVQINATLKTIAAQRQQVVALDLKSKPLTELRELEGLLLKAFDELESFLRLLLVTLTEIKDGINQIIEPVAAGVRSIDSNVNELLAQISRGAFGYPGFPARLRAIATILNP